MTVPSTPENLDEFAAAYVLGDLTPEEAEEFQRLLAANPDLVAEVQSLQDTLNDVLCGLNEVEPPPHLLLAILEAATSAPPLALPVKRFSSTWYAIAGGIGIVIMLAFGFLGWDNWRLRQELSVAQDVTMLLQTSKTRLFPMQGIETAGTASGSFVLNGDRQQGILAIQNLPPPPDGKIYRLWAVVENEKIPCGQLKANSQGIVLNKFSMPADFYDTELSGLLVTLEPSPTSRYPTGPVVMKSI
jgi:anti-sigma-K factor RskA